MDPPRASPYAPLNTLLVFAAAGSRAPRPCPRPQQPRLEPGIGARAAGSCPRPEQPRIGPCRSGRHQHGSSSPEAPSAGFWRPIADHMAMNRIATRERALMRRRMGSAGSYVRRAGPQTLLIPPGFGSPQALRAEQTGTWNTYAASPKALTAKPTTASGASSTWVGNAVRRRSRATLTLRLCNTHRLTLQPSERLAQYFRGCRH